jgi:hypothetical protein
MTARTVRPWPVGVLVSVVVALAACGNDSSAPVNAGPSEVEPAANSADVTPPAAVTTAVVATTVAPTTPAPPSSTVAAASPSNTASAEYAPATPPVFPDHSSPPPAGDGLPDGLYYAVATGASGDPSPRLTVSIYEMLSGPAAIAAADADGVGLDSDVYVRSMASAERQLDLGPGVAISVAQADKPGTSYTVSGAELVRLLAGAKPSAGAPAMYQYVPFPYLITVQGGVPSRVEQLWSP